MSKRFPKPGKQKSQKQRRIEHVKELTKPLKKSDREKVYQKYDGRCAYCGHGIEYGEMQVDHKIAKAVVHHNEYSSANWWDNLMPSCRACNIRKNTMSIKRFKQELNRDIEQLKRDSAKFRLLLKYGKIKIVETDDLFYFEKVSIGMEEIN